MSTPQQLTLSEADAEAIAEKFNIKLFETFGFDISTVEGRLEAQGAFRHLLFWYRWSALVGKVGVTGIIGIGVAWAVWKLTGWGGPTG